MAERIRNITAVAVIVGAIVIIVAVLAADSGTDGDRAHELASTLKCPVCTSESVADSPSQVARDLYDLIEERIAEGWTDDEIVAFFVATYGEETLLDPPASGSTAVLWIAPLVAVAIGGIAIAGRRTRVERAPTAEERRRVAEALEDS